MVDWSGMYAAIYTTLGVSATLTPLAGGAVTLTVLDDSRGVEIGNHVDVMTVQPAACVRMADLTAAGLSRDNLRRASLVMSGKVWRVENTMPKPAPTGEASGELYLLLSEVA